MTHAKLSHRTALGTLTVPTQNYTMVVSRPAEEPRLWHEYLVGASDAYRRQGCLAALDFASVVDGDTTCLFFAVVDGSGRVRGGLRVQNPLTVATQSHALEEWQGQSAQVDLVNAIESRLHEGIVEVKSAWVDDRWPFASQAAAQLARSGLPVMEICRVEHAMATAADHVLRRWESGGGRIDPSVAPTPFPSDRYRTRLMWWTRATLRGTTPAAAWMQMRHETDVLLGVQTVP